MILSPPNVNESGSFIWEELRGRSSVDGRQQIQLFDALQN